MSSSNKTDTGGSDLNPLPVFGLVTDPVTGEVQVQESILFYLIHGLALVSLSVSIIISIGVIIYLFKSSPEKNLFKRQIGERLVVYLSIVDLCYRWVYLLFFRK